jgi:hypothetical protein
MAPAIVIFNDAFGGYDSVGVKIRVDSSFQVNIPCGKPLKDDSTDVLFIGWLKYNVIGEKCPITEFKGGSVSTSAGGNTLWNPVRVGAVSVGALKIGMFGAPEHEAMIRLMRMRQFRLSGRRARVLVEVRRFFVIMPSDRKLIQSHYTLVAPVK